MFLTIDDDELDNEFDDILEDSDDEFDSNLGAPMPADEYPQKKKSSFVFWVALLLIILLGGGFLFTQLSGSQPSGGEQITAAIPSSELEPITDSVDSFVDDVDRNKASMEMKTPAEIEIVTDPFLPDMDTSDTNMNNDISAHIESSQTEDELTDMLMLGARKDVPQEKLVADSSLDMVEDMTASDFQDLPQPSLVEMEENAVEIVEVDPPIDVSADNAPKQDVETLKARIDVLEKRLASLEGTGTPSAIKEPEIQKSVHKHTSLKQDSSFQASDIKTKSVSAPVKKNVTLPKWIIRGAQPGKALLSSQKSNGTISVKVGDALSGLGVIEYIGLNKDNIWEVRGSLSSVFEPQ